jgi:hypothetical protein
MKWSASNNGFYSALNSLIPDDAIDISDELYHSLLDGNMAGMIIVTGENGLPELQQRPAPSVDELRAMAEQQKLSLRSKADSEIGWRQDAVDAGIATDEETAALAEWKKYRVLLMRVDTSITPDINWPVQPQ